MKTLELVEQLLKIYKQHGDVEVLMTDGYNVQCYRGDYQVQAWQDDNGIWTADIGIGGCNEE